MLNSYDVASVLTNLTGNAVIYSEVENALYTSLLRLNNDGIRGAEISNEIQLLLTKLENSVVIYDKLYNRVVAIIERGFECYFDDLKYPTTNNERFTVISGYKLFVENGIVNTIQEIDENC